MRANSAVIASVLILSLFTGCRNEEQSEDIAPTPVVVRKKKPKAANPNATTATPGAAQSPGSTAKSKTAPASSGKATGNNYVKQKLTQLNGYLPAAVKALQANDVDTAKGYAKSFSDNWQQKVIQNGVKSKSQDSYNKISAGVTQVNNLMKAPTPDKTKAVSALQSLSQAVTQYVQSPS
ncbi:MAG TPA: hypothetical protein V6D14_10935 [Coleofasciculaceae cyanobacterium]|jgi:hypothetical protein